MAGTLAWAQLIAAPPALVVTIDDDDSYEFLAGLAQNTDGYADGFNKVADAKALWAAQVDFDAPGATEGSVFPSTSGSAVAWVCSAEAFKRLKALRF